MEIRINPAPSLFLKSVIIFSILFFSPKMIKASFDDTEIEMPEIGSTQIDSRYGDLPTTSKVYKLSSRSPRNYDVRTYSLGNQYLNDQAGSRPPSPRSEQGSLAHSTPRFIIPSPDEHSTHLPMMPVTPRNTEEVDPEDVTTSTCYRIGKGCFGCIQRQTLPAMQYSCAILAAAFTMVSALFSNYHHEEYSLIFAYVAVFFDALTAVFTNINNTHNHRMQEKEKSLAEAETEKRKERENQLEYLEETARIQLELERQRTQRREFALIETQTETVQRMSNDLLVQKEKKEHYRQFASILSASVDKFFQIFLKAEGLLNNSEVDLEKLRAIVLKYHEDYDNLQNIISFFAKTTTLTIPQSISTDPFVSNRDTTFPADRKSQAASQQGRSHPLSPKTELKSPSTPRMRFTHNPSLFKAVQEEEKLSPRTIVTEPPRLNRTSQIPPLSSSRQTYNTATLRKYNSKTQTPSQEDTTQTSKQDNKKVSIIPVEPLAQKASSSNRTFTKAQKEPKQDSGKEKEQEKTDKRDREKSKKKGDFHKKKKTSTINSPSPEASHKPNQDKQGSDHELASSGRKKDAK